MTSPDASVQPPNEAAPNETRPDPRRSSGTKKLVHHRITKSVIGGFFTVHDTLGYGFLEAPYVNAIVVELRKRGHHVRRNCSLPIYYDGVLVERYYVDLLIDDKVVVEVKAHGVLRGEHRRQLRNYLAAGSFRVGLLLNFGPVPEFHRELSPHELRNSNSTSRRSSGSVRPSPPRPKQKNNQDQTRGETR